MVFTTYLNKLIVLNKKLLNVYMLDFCISFDLIHSSLHISSSELQVVWINLNIISKSCKVHFRLLGKLQFSGYCNFKIWYGIWNAFNFWSWLIQWNFNRKFVKYQCFKKNFFLHSVSQCTHFRQYVNVECQNYC